MNHISKSRMREFCAKSLEVPELAEIVEHMEGCSECKELFHDVFQERTGPFPYSINLSHSWLRYEHLEYEQLVAYVDNKLDEIDREMLDVHLNGCASCREDVRSFLDYRKQAEPFMNVRYEPKETQRAFSINWLRGNTWAGFAALAAILVVGSVIAIFVFRGSGSQRRESAASQDRRTPSEGPNKAPAVPAPLSDSGVTTHTADQTSSSSVTSRRSLNTSGLNPTAAAHNSAQLRDGRNKIVIDADGNISGFPQASDLVKQVLASGTVKRPDALNILRGEPNSLRGASSNDLSFRLLSPVGVVISRDKPTFSWEPVKDASTYEVIVADLSGHEVARSPRLSSEATQWTTAAPLKRGSVYTWAVTADVQGQEITSPSASATEAKFKVLDDAKQLELERLRNESDSHLRLGLLYANFGMIDDAEREFRTLASENPRSTLALKLVRAVQSWR